MEFPAEEQHTENTSLHKDDAGDHVHGQVAWVMEAGNRKLEPVVDFPYDAIDGVKEVSEEKVLTWADCTSLLIRVTDWCLRARSMTECGGRLCALRHWLNDGSSGFESYTQIARESGVTKAAVSNWLLSLADSIDLKLPVGKVAGSRARYRKAQLQAVAKGTHSSVKRIDKKSPAPAPVVETKWCHTCDKDLPLTAFYHCGRSADGYGSECKACYRTKRGITLKRAFSETGPNLKARPRRS